MYRLRFMNWIVFTKWKHELSWTEDFFTIWNEDFKIVTLVNEDKVLPFIFTNKWIKVR